MNPSNGNLVIISGPSGAGKSTVVQDLLQKCPLPLVVSVSATTRAARPGEIDGQHYHFLTHEEFQQRRENDEFLEYKEVFSRGDWYGTLRSEVSSGLTSGKWVVLEIDVEGAFSVLEQGTDAVTVFIHPGSMEELEKRLRARGTETEDSLQRRLKVAKKEMATMDRYRHEVVNDDKDRAVEELSQLLQQYK